MKTVQILMSTYNGEKYIREQLDSIINQTYPSIKVLVRDDGSSDGTIGILEEYATKYDNIVYYPGKNLGVIKSFLQLLKDSDDSAEYYAFSDQDDVWLPEKIEKAVEMIENVKNAELPILYCGDTYLTDGSLNMIKAEEKHARPSLGNALVQNICTGCTAVMNHELREIINQTNPVNIVMHDWWFYLVAAMHGKVVYDQKPYMYYRQHGNNEWGVKTSKREILKYRLGQLKKKRGYIYRQNEELFKAFAIMDTKHQKMISMVQDSENGIIGKIRLIFNKRIYRTTKENDLVYRLAVLLGKL